MKINTKLQNFENYLIVENNLLEKESFWQKLKDKVAKPIFRLDQYEIKKRLFEQEFSDYIELKKLISKKLNKKTINLYYPGSGPNIVYPFIYLDIFTNNTQKINLVLQDYETSPESSIFIIKKLTGNTNYKMTQLKKQNKNIIKVQFNFKNKIINIYHVNADANKLFPHLLSNNIDIYLERAFTLFRSDNELFEKNIFLNLKKGGLIITDSGLLDKKLDLKQISIELPKGLGFYKNLSVYQKQH